jgi:predicted DNA-binding transcriptional regulator YafY
VGDLVKEEDCHPRTIYRDLEALQEAGFPIYSDRVDGKGVWSVGQWLSSVRDRETSAAALSN